MDFVGVDDDLSGYKVVIAPMLYMCKDGYDEKIRSFVKAGGTFLTSYFSGYRYTAKLTLNCSALQLNLGDNK